MSVPVLLKDVKLGDYFSLRPGGPLYVRNHYVRESKCYSISPYEDVNRELFRKGALVVYI